MKKVILLLINVVLVISMIVLYNSFNEEQKLNEQYEGYLSQHIGNEISSLYGVFNENQKIWDEILTTKTITKDQVKRIEFNHYRMIKNHNDMEQLETFLRVETNENSNAMFYSFYDSIIDLGERYLGRINSNDLKGKYSSSLSNKDLTIIKEIQRLHEDWLSVIEGYKNPKDLTVKQHYWVDFWKELDKATNQNEQFKEVIR